MRFSIDAHAIGRHLTGNEAYVRNLLNGFAKLDKFSEFITYLSVEGAANWVPARFTQRIVANNPFLRLGYDLSAKLRQDRPDLIHVQYTAPLACPVPVVVSIHDISYLEHPEFFTTSRSLQLRFTVNQTIKRASRILTLSDFSRRAIERAYNLTEDKVIVVPAAVSNSFRPISRENAVAHVKDKFKIVKPFVLTVGDLQPRKNPLGMIKAFDELLNAHPDLPHDLVFVGNDTWFSPRVRQAAEGSRFRERIHFTGYVDENDLLQFYNACEIFVFPTFYEGFGIPILEAMACGRAVACANVTAIPEVADAAAILFNPHQSDEMVRAMRDLLVDRQLRERMERLGLNNAAHFSWDRTAQKTLEVYYGVEAENRKHKSSAAAPQHVSKS
jgi:glycosyltransferase involved in cell wall biosynthesis